jgi:RNA polymerase sigma-70 factor (ECF subfamily)
MSGDNEVIERVLAGDVSSFRTLVERHEQQLFCLLRNLLPDQADCEDLAQETFLASYRPEAARFSTWLLAIARNKCLNLLRKRRPVTVATLPEQADPHAPDRALAETEFFRQLDLALALLPLEQKTAFILAEIQGLSYEEIGTIEGVGLGTVKSRVGRAREKLRSLLQPKAEQA